MKKKSPIEDKKKGEAQIERPHTGHPTSEFVTVA